MPALAKTAILLSTMGQFPLTLGRFIAQEQADHPAATGEFSGLLSQIGLVGKLLAQDLRRAGLTNILGTTSGTNVQGETIKKLDEIANQTFLKVFDQSGLVCALASEEMEKPVLFAENWPEAKYMLLFDPLDGSSNTDCNMPLGAIFSVVMSASEERMPAEDDLIRNGTEQVAAGYLLFGSSTMLVYTVGRSYLLELFHSALQAAQVKIVDGTMSRQAYAQLAELDTEVRESGIVYSCPSGKHDDLGISCAMLTWAARHPHLDFWASTALAARRPRPPRDAFGWRAFV